MTPIDVLLNSIDWKPLAEQETNDSGLPFATHEGVIEFCGERLRVVQLSTGQRVILAEDLERLMGA